MTREEIVAKRKEFGDKLKVLSQKEAEISQQKNLVIDEYWELQGQCPHPEFVGKSDWRDGWRECVDCGWY